MAVTLKIKHCFLARVLEVDGKLSLPDMGLSLSSTTEDRVKAGLIKIQQATLRFR